MQVLIYHSDQCDSKKCTGARLIRQEIVRGVRDIGRLKHTVFLNPYERIPLSIADRPAALKMGVGLIDASWAHAMTQHQNFKAKVPRRLPHLIPVNPMNYGKVSLLTSAEAIAGALFILGEEEEARRVLNAIQWGPHFEELNRDLIELYKSAKNHEEILKIERDVRFL